MVTPAYASEIDEEPVIVETTEAVEDIDIDEEIIVDEEIIDDEEIISDEEIASEEAANEVDWDDATDLDANVDFVDSICEVKIAANTEKFYDLSSALGMELMADDEKIGIVDVDTDYRFSIKNDEAKEKVVILKLQHPVGSVENPEILFGLGENTATMFSEKYYYSYTAVDSCVLEFTADTANADAAFSIRNQNDENWDAVGGVLSVQVTAGDVLSIAVAGSYSEITWNFNYAVGSAQNPIPVEFTWNSAGTEAYAEITIPAETTNVYSGGISGMVLFVDGVKTQILTSEGVLEPVYFTLTNETQEAKAVSLHLEWPVGSRDNPEVLMNFTESQNKLEFTVEEGNSDGYFFTYITEADGEYIFYKENSFDGDILISVDGEQYSLLQDGDDVSEELSVSVVAGKTMTIQFVPGSEVSSTIVGVVIAEFTHPYGSYENPVQLEWYWSGEGVEAWTNVAVPEGETWYVQVLAGMELWIDDEDFLGIMRPDGNGNCVIALTGGEHYLNAWWPTGTKQNPDYIYAGDWFIASFDEYTQDYYFVLYPQYYGTLMFNLEQFTGDTWSFTAENENTKEKIFASDMNQDGFNNGQMYVKKGDKVLITVSNSGPDTEQTFVVEQKLDAKYVATFDQTVTSGKTLTLNFIHPETGKKISASKVNWEIASITYYSPYNFAGEDMSEDGSSVDEKYYSAYATLSNGKLKTLKNADSVFIYINATLKENPDYRNEFCVEMLPAANMLNVRWLDAYAYKNGRFEHDNVYTTEILDLNGRTQANDDFLLVYVNASPANVYQTVTWSGTKITRIVETVVEDEYGNTYPAAKIYPVWDSNGKFKEGVATITAKDNAGNKFSFKVEITSLPRRVEIQHKDIEMIYGTKTIFVKPGQKINLKAVFDSNASAKKCVATWGLDAPTPGSKVSKGTVTVSKNAFDGENIYVWAEKCLDEYFESYIGDVVCLTVQTPKSPDCVELLVEDYWHSDDCGESVLDWAFADSTVYYNITKDNVRIPVIRSFVRYDETDEYFGQNVTWSIDKNGAKIAELDTSMVVVREWNADHGHEEYIYYNREDMPQGNDVEWYPVAFVVPIVNENGEAKSGTVKLTAVAPDGKTKKTITIKFVKQVTELEIVTADGKNMTDYGDILATAGQKVKLAAKTNADATNKAMIWSVEPGFEKYASVNSKGIVTISKNVPSDGVGIPIRVEPKDPAYNGMAEYAYICVSPLATNIHTRIDFGEGMRYVTNSTQTLDLKNLEPDANGVKKVELSALVYPFEASQNITWSLDGAGKKVARIEKTKDATYLIFNGNSGKMTVTATANDGSKQKASFKLNLPASIIEELYLEAPYFQTAGKTVKMASYLTINPTKPAAKDLRWAMQVSSVDTETWMPEYFSDVPSGIATLDQKGNLKIGKNLTAPIMLDVFVEDRISGNVDMTRMLVMPKAMTGVVVRDLNGNEIKKGTTVKVDESAFAFTLEAKNGSDYTLAKYHWMAAFSGSVDKEELAEIGVWNDEYPCVFQTGDAGKVKVTIKAEDGSKKSTYFYIQFENTAPEIC